MRLKTALFLITLGVVGSITASFFVSNVYLSQVIEPFSSVKRGDGVGKTGEFDTTRFEGKGGVELAFIDEDLQTGWMPWVIKQVSILIGGLSLLLFLYAGIALIIYGDNEEQLGKSMKIFAFSVVGISVAALSYTIVSNLLNLF
mgnify:CR=1 FL=1